MHLCCSVRAGSAQSDHYGSNAMSTLDDLAHEPEHITITREQYDDMVDDCCMLQALRDYGVDQWEGFGLAYNEYKRMMGSAAW
jgi:hypothetical protein